MTDTTGLLTITRDTAIAEDAERGLTLCAVPALHDEFVQQIEQATFGTSGLRYRRLNVASQIDRLPNPTFIEMRKGEKLVGTYVLAGSNLTFEGTEIQGVYRALQTVTEEESGSGLGRWMTNHTLEWVGQRATEIGNAAMTWGCVEERNEPSLHILQSLGLEPLGSLESMMVYRQWPKKERRIAEVDAD
ncbi:MAG: hypothetical protein AAGA61_10460, partial [Pseudomonadota bacterium]